MSPCLVAVGSEIDWVLRCENCLIVADIAAMSAFADAGSFRRTPCDRELPIEVSRRLRGREGDEMPVVVQ